MSIGSLSENIKMDLEKMDHMIDIPCGFSV